MEWNNNNNKALIATLLFHALIVVALLLLALRTPLPLPGEQGVEVRMGNDNTGMGTKPATPPVAKKKQETPPRQEKTPPVKKEPAKKEVITQNTEKAPALPKKQPKKEHQPKKVVAKPKPKPEKKVEKPKEEQPKDTPAPKQQEKPKPVVNQRALFKLNKKQTATNSGNQTGTGNMGKPHGISESDNISGKGGEGNGISYNLGGRGSAYLDKPAANFTEQGIVVVKIWVNPAGDVIRAQVYAKGTTVVNEKLRNMAIRAAKNSKFVSDPTAPAEQTGTITYRFILKK